MSSSLMHYSPEDVNVLFGGVSRLSGFVDGTFVRIAKSSPMYTTRESADGNVTRVHKNSQMYDVYITLASTSESNQILTYAARLDELTQMAKFPLLIKDTLGSTMFFSMTSWIEEMPDSSFSTNVESREWKIKCSQAVFNVGGNEGPSSAVTDILNGVAGLAPGLGRLI